jgi:hypothetical protein
MFRFNHVFSATPAKIKPLAPRSYQCRCGKPIFFRNSRCLACGSPLGFEPNLGRLYALESAGEPDLWKLVGDADEPRGRYRRCANLTSISGCNWLLPVEDPANGTGTNRQTLCQSCRLDRTIPDLSVAADAEAYRSISNAKRRLVSFLIALGLPVESRVSEDPERGLAFDFLRSPAQGPRVMTGHDNGIITLNIEEAEDSTRERIRGELGEPYRTLLGHLRHETGHYYWDRLIENTNWIDGYRKLFGDERQDYAAAIQAHYQSGPAPGWQQTFVSAYASTHPWEDWAETWAHYLHVMDTLETALGYGLDAESSIEMDVKPFEPDALFRPADPSGAQFLHFLNSWTRLTAVLNELSRAMGLHDFYPFALPRAAVAKLHFVHLVVTEARSSRPDPEVPRDLTVVA